jgi:hypothetical protein
LTPPVSDYDIARTVEVRARHKDNVSAAAELGVNESTVRRRMAVAAERGMLSLDPVMPGFAIKSVASKTVDGKWVKQVKAAGDVHEIPEGFTLKRDSAYTDGEGRRIGGWRISEPSKEQQLAAMRAVADALKEELPRLPASPAPAHVREDLLNQFVITDSHFGMLAWHEETGASYDLRIAEQLLLDWFSVAIELAPPAHTAVFAQLGDFMHHDALESVTPAHKHVLDADSRLQKIIRVVIRTTRRVIDMLLRKHQHVHIVMAAGNHDPASSAWLREMLAAMYENEPRITVDNSPSLYYAYEWGGTMLAYHHGHKRGVKDVDAVVAAIFREMYGRSSTAYVHVGHRHSDEGKKTRLMYVEQHETLAAKDAFNAGGGWPGGRSAKVITYSKTGGEVIRLTLRPEMVAGAAKLQSANDNSEWRAAA